MRKIVFIVLLTLNPIVAPQLFSTSYRPALAHSIGMQRFWWRLPVIATGQIEEAFLGSMARHYGPDWLRWMPDAVIAEHWHRFPAAFGHGPEAAFLQWMNHRFGLGWQAWVPTPQVHRSWQHFCGR